MKKKTLTLFEIHEVIKKELTLYSIGQQSWVASEDYIMSVILKFINDDTHNESYHNNNNIALVISSCLTNLGIKNEITLEPIIYTIRRLGA